MGPVPAPPESRAQSGRLTELVLLVLLAAFVAILLNTFVAQAFYIPSASMVPQLQVNDRVVVSKLAYRLHSPRRGDVVVFPAPPSEQQPQGGAGNPVGRAFQRVGRTFGVAESQTELIKRVIALPGETVEGRYGRLYIDGRPLKEPYLPAGTVTSNFGPLLVPPGQLWVMGDNRTDSSDSRVFGTISRAGVVGRAIWRVWPLDHVSFL